MNLKKLGRTLGIVVAVAMLAMVLQGSGDAPGGTLTANRVGSTVTLAATDASDTTLYSFDAMVGDDGMTSGMTEMDVPGGRTQHIYLMTDIDDTGSRTFAQFAASTGAGLESAVADTTVDSQEYRYPVTVLGGAAELNGENAGDNAKDPRDSYAGSLHGISGRFVCSGANCQVRITPTYQ